MCMGILKKGAQKPPLSCMGSKGRCPSPVFGTFKVWGPPIRYVASSRGCTLQFCTNPSCLDLGVDPAVPCKSNSRLPKTSRVLCTFRALFAKGEGFHVGIGCSWVGLPMGKRGNKIEDSGWERVAEICMSIGQSSRDWHFSEMQWQVKGLRPVFWDPITNKGWRSYFQSGQ